jgi:BirA family transcriptional regulator, biotin operon repressor / biotin---[acetyl-CoA-carboxylase] ligase
MSPKQQAFPFIKLDVVDSTNNYAMNLVREGWDRNFTCIWAIDQNQGKGQRGNTWQSEAGKNLTCSIIFFPADLDALQNFYLSMSVCLAAKKFLLSFCKNVSIKWPNDLYLENKKTGGILIENVLEKQNIKSSIIGIGINLNQSEFAADIPNATSVFLNSQMLLNVENSAISLYHSIVEYLKKLDLKLRNEIKKEYLESLYGLGVSMKFRDSGGDFTGIIQGVEDTGQLIILDNNSKARKYYFKEVELIF